MIDLIKNENETFGSILISGSNDDEINLLSMRVAYEILEKTPDMVFMINGFGVFDDFQKNISKVMKTKIKTKRLCDFRGIGKKPAQLTVMSPKVTESVLGKMSYAKNIVYPVWDQMAASDKRCWCFVPQSVQEEIKELLPLAKQKQVVFVILSNNFDVLQERTLHTFRHVVLLPTEKYHLADIQVRYRISEFMMKYIWPRGLELTEQTGLYINKAGVEPFIYDEIHDSYVAKVKETKDKLPESECVREDFDPDIEVEEEKMDE